MACERSERSRRELTALADGCGAPPTARLAWQLAACTDSRQVEPWVLLLRDTTRYGGRRRRAGRPRGGPADPVHDPRRH